MLNFDEISTNSSSSGVVIFWLLFHKQNFLKNNLERIFQAKCERNFGLIQKVCPGIIQK
jgi:hypothetical protein